MDQKSILEMINRFSMDATSARAGAILLLNKKKRILTVEVVEGLYPPVMPVDEFISSKEKYLIEKFKNDPIQVGQSYLGKVAEEGKPLFIKDALHEPSIIQSAKGVMDISSIIALPLIADNETLGVMSVLNKTTDAFFSDEDFLLAKALAEQVAVALNTVKLRNEYQEKLQQEKQVAIAAQIQQGLLPSVFPTFDQMEVFAHSKAAKGVSGDYFDMLSFQDKLAIVCADVAGKGVPAAMVMVKIQTALRLIARPESEPRNIISAINKALAGQVAEDRYATLFFCMLDIHTGLLSYSNAGHGPMIVYRALTDSFELLDTEGLPVGITPDTDYGQDETVLNSGDIAMLYTDGITEAMNARHDEYTIARVKEDIRSLKELDAKEISLQLLEKIAHFVGEEPQHDDQTLIIIKMK
jgi:sigma-B regulation protein RsbU (phosphoserine phosphatase)